MSQGGVPEEMIPWLGPWHAGSQSRTEKVRSRSNRSPCGLKPMAECRAPQYPAGDMEQVERGLLLPTCKYAHPADGLRLMHDGAIDLAETHALLHGAQPGPGQHPNSKRAQQTAKTTPHQTFHTLYYSQKPRQGHREWNSC